MTDPTDRTVATDRTLATDRTTPADRAAAVRARGSEDPETPTQAIWSIAAGVGPLPFLAVYSVIFIAHGFIWPVEPPDITTTRPVRRWRVCSRRWSRW